MSTPADPAPAPTIPEAQLEHPERPAGAAPRRRDERFPWWIGIVGFLAALAVAAVGYAIVAGIASAAGARITEDDTPAGVTIAATFLQDLAFLGVPFLLVLLATGKVSRGAFGLRRPARIGRVAALVAGTYVAFIVFTGLWTTLLGITEQQQTLDDLGTRDSTAALVAVCVLVCVLAPVAEEVLFRGLVFPSLRNGLASTFLRRLALPLAVVATGALFGVVHYDGSSASVGYLVPLALFGAALCLLYWRTGSLLPCIALHAINNSIAFGSGVGWSWQIPLLLVGVLGVLALAARGLERVGLDAGPRLVREPRPGVP